MRLGFHLGLPGPFALTSGGRRARRSGLGLLVFAGLLYLGAWFMWTVPMVIAHSIAAVVAGVAALVIVVQKRGR